MRSSSCRCYIFSLGILIPFAVLIYALRLALRSTDGQELSSSGPRATESLRFITVVSRHGNRGPVFNFSNSPYPVDDPKYWPYGMRRLTPELESCPRFLEEREKYTQIFGEEYSTNVSSIVRYIYNQTGVNITGINGFIEEWDMFICEDSEGYTLPDWTKTVYPEPMIYLAGKLYIAFFTASDIMVRLLIGPFFGEMLQVLESKVNGTLAPDRKMYFYSGHDTSLMSLQLVLGIPLAEITSIVKPGSAIIFELHQDSQSKDYYTQVLYIDGSSPDLKPVLLDIPNCGSICSFNQFINITHKFANVTNYEQECQLKNTIN
uniref:acid phosphatase n=1 Tax=Cuerna arida TaxID=1464854 RepID=A0A1B6FRS5_9HEMI